MVDPAPDFAASRGGFLARYDRMATKAAQQVIGQYSTSFSLATRVLGGRVRTDIRNFYAVVRIADEIVDGTAHAAGLDDSGIAATLDAYEDAVLSAPHRRFHVDPILHAYAITARRCNFDADHIAAFFSSMRRDLEQSHHDSSSFQDYVYGSAEVIGLLCLEIFLVDNPVTDAERARLESGARDLGAAFQKINFLRDLTEDIDTLGRTYFPGLKDHSLSEEHKDELIKDIRADLDQARIAIPLLPLSARTGVLVATELFSKLTEELDALSAEGISTQRVSVSARDKAAVMARALATAPRMGSK